MNRRDALKTMAVTGATCVAATVSQAPSAGRGGEVNVPDRFVISCWSGPLNGAISVASYREMADLGLNVLAMSVNEHYGHGDIAKALACAQAVSLPILIADDRISGFAPCPPGAYVPPDWNQIDSLVDDVVSDWSGSDSRFGYFLRDEPSADGGEFANLSRVVSRLRSKDPSRVAFVNLLPSYGVPRGIDAYKKYVTDFVTTVKPNVLSFDHYPDDDTFASKQKYRIDLQIISDAASKSGIPFWSVVCCLPPPSPKGTTIEFLRWQVMEAIHFGSKGILYFYYATPPCPRPLPGLLDAAGNRTARYGEVQALNRDIRAIVDGKADVLFGTVRNDAGKLYLLDRRDVPQAPANATTARFLAAEPWNWTQPGYSYVNRVFDSNGFWLAARDDLASKTFYVGNVLAGTGHFYKVTKDGVTTLPDAIWNEARGGVVLGRFHDDNGFWVATV